MKKKVLVGLLIGVALLTGVGIICSSPEEAQNETQQVETIEAKAETKDEKPEEKKQEKKDEEKKETEEEQTKQDTSSNESDEVSPDETEDHYDELVNDKRMNDLQILAKALSEASGRTYDDTWNDVYNCAITYGFEYAQDYANTEIQKAKVQPKTSGQASSKEELLNNIDDWDYACIMYEYIPSSNVGGGSYAAEASKYSSYTEFYFSTSQQTRNQLKSLFKGQCPSITGEDSWRFQSQINGCGNELREAIRATM